MFRTLTISVMCLTHKEVMVKVHVVDLKSENIAPPISVRAYLNQTITEFKQLISQVLFYSPPLCFHLQSLKCPHSILIYESLLTCKCNVKRVFLFPGHWSLCGQHACGPGALLQ